VWGAPPEETFTCGIYQNENVSFGWYWNRPHPKLKPGQTYAQPLYPSIRIGGNPWEPSKSPLFPFRWGDARLLKFDIIYRYTQFPTGAYDLAYDIFFTESSQPGPDVQRKAEVMIWINGTQKQPPNSYKGDFSDGNNSYALYSRAISDGRLYFAFMMQGSTQFESHHSVDAKKLMDNLELNPAWYVHGVELGNEVWNSFGEIEISKVTITLNGTQS
jgi:hypothetical protein